jgi:hypothetical protein
MGLPVRSFDHSSITHKPQGYTTVPRFRSAAWLVCIPVILVVTDQTARRGFTPWQPQSFHAEYRRDLEAAAGLESCLQEVRRSNEVKETLIHHMIAGRVSLAEVTHQFLLMNQSRAAYMLVIRTQYVGNSDEEKSARNVLERAASALSYADQDTRAHVLARLEGELECNIQSSRIQAPNAERTPPCDSRASCPSRCSPN